MTVKKFKAVLKQNGSMDAGYIEIPFDVEKYYGAKRVKVKALLNGSEYRGSVVRMGTSCHILGIPQNIRSIINAAFGDIIDVELFKDEDERTVALPEDLKRKLSETALKAFQMLPYTRQKQYVLSVESAKQESTRSRRITEIAGEMDLLSHQL